ncbi:MAG: hypothetical protein KIT82_06995 [Bradyrhizobium sp.]|nr:hypothetical protein [Bradyrhizobium sp.]
MAGGARHRRRASRIQPSMIGKLADPVDASTTERGLLLQFYVAKFAALRSSPATGAMVAALRSALSDERRAALRALAELWRHRRKAWRQEKRRQRAQAQRPQQPRRPSAKWQQNNG